MINIIGNRIGAKKSGGAANLAFEFTVKTDNAGTSAADQFTIPITSTTPYDISTSDGHSITGATGATTLTFSAPGTYTVKITDSCEGWRFANGGDRRKLMTIENWGVFTFTTNEAFHGCNFVVANYSDTPTIATTTLQATFASCANFNGYVNDWDISGVTNIGTMFFGCSSFTQDLGNWDVSSVTTMGYMFNDATNYTGIGLENWNAPLNTSLEFTFRRTKFNADISSWDVSNVNSFYLTFSDTPFNQDISGWTIKTSGNINMRGMFLGATSFNQPIGSWNTSAVGNMLGMFSGATSFNQPLNTWNTITVTDTQQMFQNATSFNQDISSWNVSNVGRADRMFSGATSFNQDLPNWTWTNLQFQGLDYMFERAYAFNGDLSNWTFPNVTRLVSVFDGVGSNMAFNNSSIANWDVSNITSLANTFRKCESFNVDLSSWNTASLTNMTNTFFNCGSFNQPLNSWNVSNVTTFSYCFYFATSFNQPLNNWNVSSCTRFNQMFFQATSFNQNIGNWNMSSAVSGDTFKEMFRNATAYDNGGQPINWITVAGPTDISQWFYNTPAFTQSLQSINITTAVNNLNFTFNSNITTSNYDATLVAWESQLQAAYPGGVGYTPPLYTWQFSGATYTLGSAAETARTSLVNTFGWTITDGGGVLTNESYLVASYNFDSNFTDYTGNNNLTAFGNATAGVTGGKVSNCLEVDGVDDYGLAVDSDDFSFTNGSNDLPFSISLWANADTLGTGNLVQKRGVTSLLEYQVFILSSQIVVNLFSGGNTTNQLRTRVFDTYSTGVWYHITVTYDGSGNNSGLKVYVNGSLPTQTLDPLNSYVGMSNTTSAFTIGTYGSGVDDFDGKIDEVHVWKNRELTAAEVTDIYNTENAGNSILP